MAKWEYLVEDEDLRAGPEGALALQTALDRWGVDGWELVDVFRIHRTGGDEFRLFFKRRVQE